MKVYATSTAGKPPKGRFPNWAELDFVNKADGQFLFARNGLSGRPFPRKWRTIEFYNATPTFPKPDFYSAGAWAWIVSERILELAGEPLEMSGELLPVQIQGESGAFFLHNVTNTINVVNHEASSWESYGPKREFKKLIKPAFFAERFGEECLFKITEDAGTTIYCLERTGEADAGEFKAIVECNGLTGIDFQLVWSDDSSGTTNEK